MNDKILKVLVTGFFNAGKTTLIHALDDNALSIETMLRVPVDEEKTHTTTGFDLGRLIWARPNARAEMEGIIMSKTIYMKEKSEYLGWHVMDVELKGCPDNLQFSEVRKSLARGSYGVLIVVDGCDLKNIGNALVILEETKVTSGEDIPMSIIANKADRSDYHGSELISRLVGIHVHEGSAKENVGVKDALIQVLRMIVNNGAINL